MSSTTDSLKQSANEPNPDEPNSKKPKLNDLQSSAPTTGEDNKNGTTANMEKLDSKNNNNNNVNASNKVPTKVANGSEDNNEQQQDDNNTQADEDDDGNLDGVFDPKIAKSLEEVENIQNEISILNEKASDEILKVEQKFNQLRRPYFEKRNELLKEIPNFWLTSLANHATIAPMIESAEDEDCLHYMVNLDVEEFEDIKSGYRLKFHFKPNPYINNTIIVKEFQVISPEEVTTNANILDYKKTKEGEALKAIVERSLSMARSNRLARRPDDQRHQSFFAWLVDTTEYGQDEIADILKDHIWPNPLELFFQTPGEDYDGSDDDEDDDEDEEIGEEIITGGVEFSEDEEIEGEEEDDEDDDDEEEDDEEDEDDEEL